MPENSSLLAVTAIDDERRRKLEQAGWDVHLDYPNDRGLNSQPVVVLSRPAQDLDQWVMDVTEINGEYQVRLGRTANGHRIELVQLGAAVDSEETAVRIAVSEALKRPARDRVPTTEPPGEVHVYQ